jgi:hypothetical protein
VRNAGLKISRENSLFAKRKYPVPGHQRYRKVPWDMKFAVARPR